MDADRRSGQPVGHEELELRLEIFRSIAEPGRRYSQAQRALAKLRRAAQRRGLKEAA